MKYKPPRNTEKAYLVRGTKEAFHTLNVINGVIPVDQIKRVAATYNATITEYLNAVLLYALLQRQQKGFHIKLRPVKIAMPINLRQFFPSRKNSVFAVHATTSGRRALNWQLWRAIP